MLVLSVRDAINEYHRKKTDNSLDEVTRLAAMCNRSELLDVPYVRSVVASETERLRRQLMDANAEIERLRALNEDKHRHLEAYRRAATADAEEILRLRADIANAVARSKERCPDYPWHDSATASEAAWAVGSALEGTDAARDDWRKKAGELQAANELLRMKLEEFAVTVGGAIETL